MPTWNLKSTGPVARYLGFIVGKPTYKPRSFCSLFWMLVFSPLIFVFCRVVALWCWAQSKIDTALENSFNREVQALILRYEVFPNEALIDYYENISRARWDIHKRDRVRYDKLVCAAFNQLMTKYETGYNLDVLIKLGAIPEDAGESYVENQYYTLRKSAPTKNLWRDAWSFWWIPAMILSLVALIFSPIMAADATVAFVFCCLFATAILACTFYRLELNIVVYNVYKAVKDRTCPLIVWE